MDLTLTFWQKCVIIYIISSSICLVFISYAIKRVTPDMPRYKDFVKGRKYVKLFAYIPVLNSFLAIIFIIASFRNSKKSDGNKGSNLRSV